MYFCRVYSNINTCLILDVRPSVPGNHGICLCGVNTATDCSVGIDACLTHSIKGLKGQLLCIFHVCYHGSGLQEGVLSGE